MWTIFKEAKISFQSLLKYTDIWAHYNTHRTNSGKKTRYSLVHIFPWCSGAGTGLTHTHCDPRWETSNQSKDPPIRSRRATSHLSGTTLHTRHWPVCVHLQNDMWNATVIKRWKYNVCLLCWPIIIKKCISYKYFHSKYLQIAFLNQNVLT